jgi:hypothetical protein
MCTAHAEYRTQHHHIHDTVKAANHRWARNCRFRVNSWARNCRFSVHGFSSSGYPTSNAGMVVPKESLEDIHHHDVRTTRIQNTTPLSSVHCYPISSNNNNDTRAHFSLTVARGIFVHENEPTNCRSMIIVLCRTTFLIVLTPSSI